MNDTDSLIALRDLIEEWICEAAPSDYVHGFAVGLADKCEAQIWTGCEVVAELHLPGVTVLILDEADGRA